MVQGFVTIGVNRILLSGFTPTVIAWSDADVPDESIYGSGAMTCCSVGASQERETFVLEHRNPIDFPNRGPRFWQAKGNSGCGAARWAKALGFAPVYLLGFEAKSPTHFFGAQHNNTPTQLDIMRADMYHLLQDETYKVLQDGADLVSVWAANDEIEPSQAKREVRARYDKATNP
jgi:hypothetical protein